MYDKKYTNHHNNNNRSKSPVNNNNDYNTNRFQEDYVVEPLSITVKIKKNKDTSALMSSDSKSITKIFDGKQSKFHINISCEKLSLKLQQYQIKEIIRFQYPVEKLQVG